MKTATLLFLAGMAAAAQAQGNVIACDGPMRCYARPRSSKADRCANWFTMGRALRSENLCHG